MKPDVLLEQLEGVAGRLSIRVSYETLQTSMMHGGLCKVKGEYRVIIDKRATAEERVTILASAIASFDLTALELTPHLRKVLRMHAPAPRRTAVRPAA